MTTFLSPKVEAVIRSISAVPGVEIASKFRTKQSMLCIGKYGLTEIRLIELLTKTGEHVSVFLEKLRSPVVFRVGIGAPMRNYGLIAAHKLKTAKTDVEFFTLPDGFFGPEFSEAFSSEAATQNLVSVHEIGWPMVLTSQQIEIMVPIYATEPEITACMEKVVKLVTHAPYSNRVN